MWKCGYGWGPKYRFPSCPATHAANDWAPHHSPCCWSLFGVPEIQIHLFTLRSCEMALTGVSEISANESRAGQVPGRHSLDKEESPVWAEIVQWWAKAATGQCHISDFSVCKKTHAYHKSGSSQGDKTNLNKPLLCLHLNPALVLEQNPFCLMDTIGGNWGREKPPPPSFHYHQLAQLWEQRYTQEHWEMFLLIGNE